jgi:hypothetical protein
MAFDPNLHIEEKLVIKESLTLNFIDWRPMSKALLKGFKPSFIFPEMTIP